MSVTRIRGLCPSGSGESEITMSVGARVTPKPETHGRILIADDEPATVELLTDLLSGEGYEVQGVGSGTAVLDKLQSDSDFGLLLMDLQMPGVNGLDLIERLRAAGNDTPVILITAHGTSSV